MLTLDELIDAGETMNGNRIMALDSEPAYGVIVGIEGPDEDTHVAIMAVEPFLLGIIPPVDELRTLAEVIMYLFDWFEIIFGGSHGSTTRRVVVKPDGWTYAFDLSGRLAVNTKHLPEILRRSQQTSQIVNIAKRAIKAHLTHEGIIASDWMIRILVLTMVAQRIGGIGHLAVLTSDEELLSTIGHLASVVDPDADSFSFNIEDYKLMTADTYKRIGLGVILAIFAAGLLTLAAATEGEEPLVPQTHPPDCVAVQGSQAVYESNAAGTTVDGVRYPTGQTFLREFGVPFVVTFRFVTTTTFTIVPTRDSCPPPPTTTSPPTSSTSTSSTVVESTTTTSPSTTTSSVSPTTSPPETTTTLPPELPDIGAEYSSECVPVDGGPDQINITVRTAPVPDVTYVIWFDGMARGNGTEANLFERTFSVDARTPGSSSVLRVVAGVWPGPTQILVLEDVVDTSPCSDEPGHPTEGHFNPPVPLPGVNTGLGTGREDG